MEYDKLFRGLLSIRALANTIVANDIILHVNEVNGLLSTTGKKANHFRFALMNVCGYVNFAYSLTHHILVNEYLLMKMNVSARYCLNFWCKCLRISWE